MYVTVGGSCVLCVLMSYDLVLLPASVTVLRQMVDVCEQEMTYHINTKFNTGKSVVSVKLIEMCDNIDVDLHFV